MGYISALRAFIRRMIVVMRHVLSNRVAMHRALCGVLQTAWRTCPLGHCYSVTEAFLLTLSRSVLAYITASGEFFRTHTDLGARVLVSSTRPKLRRFP